MKRTPMQDSQSRMKYAQRDRVLSLLPWPVLQTSKPRVVNALGYPANGELGSEVPGSREVVLIDYTHEPCVISFV